MTWVRVPPMLSGSKGLGCNTGYQVVGRCHTRGEYKGHVGNKAGFEILSHQKSKTDASDCNTDYL